MAEQLEVGLTGRALREDAGDWFSWVRGSSGCPFAVWLPREPDRA